MKNALPSGPPTQIRGHLLAPRPARKGTPAKPRTSAGDSGGSTTRMTTSNRPDLPQPLLTCAGLLDPVAPCCQQQRQTSFGQARQQTRSESREWRDRTSADPRSPPQGSACVRRRYAKEDERREQPLALPTLPRPGIPTSAAQLGQKAPQLVPHKKTDSRRGRRRTAHHPRRRGASQVHHAAATADHWPREDKMPRTQVVCLEASPLNPQFGGQNGDFPMPAVSNNQRCPAAVQKHWSPDPPTPFLRDGSRRHFKSTCCWAW